MKTRNRMFTVVRLLIGCTHLGLAQGQPQDHAQAEHHSVQAEINSLEATLSTLAAERYARAAIHGPPPILAVHQWAENQKILKYTDKKYTIVSVPVLPEDRLGMCEFVTRYNTYHVQAADLNARLGRYEEARELYRLLLHAELCGSSKKQLEARLDGLTKLEKGEGTSRTRELFSEHEKLGTIPDMAQIEGVKATTVTNLLTVDLPK